MVRPFIRRRVAGFLGSVVFPLFVLQGCARVVHVPPTDYRTVPERRGTAVIHARDGRIYEFKGVQADSSRFLGRVDVVRNVVGRDGHLELLDDTEEVRVPFSEVDRVEVRSPNVLGTALIVAAGVGLVYVLVKEFAPATTDTTGSGPGGGLPQGGRRVR